MLEKSIRFKGYILFESLLSLAIVGSLLTGIIPLTIFIKQQNAKIEKQVESYRLAYELAQSYYTDFQEVELEKNTSKWHVVGELQDNKKGQVQITVSIN